MSEWKPIPAALLAAVPEVRCPRCGSVEMTEDDHDANAWWCDGCHTASRYVSPTPTFCPTCGLCLSTAGYPIAHLVPDREDEVCPFVWATQTPLVPADATPLDPKAAERRMRHTEEFTTCTTWDPPRNYHFEGYCEDCDVRELVKATLGEVEDRYHTGRCTQAQFEAFKYVWATGAFRFTPSYREWAATPTDPEVRRLARKMLRLGGRDIPAELRPAEPSPQAPADADGQLPPTESPVEVTGLVTAQRYVEGMVTTLGGQAQAVERFVDTVQAAQVSGAAVAAARRAQQYTRQAAAAWASAQVALARQQRVRDAYKAASDAGTKTWLTT